MDLDGTLVDTEPHWIAAEMALVTRFGGTWSHEQALQLVGMGLGDSSLVLQAQGVQLTVPEIVDLLTDEVTERLSGGVAWRPGALELLAEVREAGVPAALVTMSVRRMAQVIVAAVPFDAFDLIVSGSDVTRPKPDPQAYLTAAEQLGVDITRSVAIEDSPPGLAAAVASGAVTVGVPHLRELPAGPGWELWPTLTGRTLADLRAVAAARETA
ncbi:HAD family hydrolase [uncultured Amnibacterium sp.]|uniref:HAD family hydrolase n=1 Tax=uncultured Amnibacterium sp. TaxID=1631851 RepID=UPI0035CB9829